MRGKLIRKQGPKSGTAWGPLHGSSGAWQEGRRPRVSCRGVSSDDSEKPRSHPWWHLDCAGIEAEPSRLAAQGFQQPGWGKICAGSRQRRAAVWIKAGRREEGASRAISFSGRGSSTETHFSINYVLVTTGAK